MNDTQYLNEYMERAKTFPLLTRKEELKCANTILKSKSDKQREKAREKLVSCNLRLVVKYANFYWKKSSVPIIDLIGAGNVGLVKAVDRFNPKKFKTKFSTFATSWIKQGIFQTLYSHGDLVHVPIHIVSYAKKRNRLNYGDHELSDEDMMKELNINEVVLEKVKRSRKYVFSLDNDVYTDREKSVKWDEIIADPNSQMPDEALDKKEMKQIVRSVIDELDPFSRDIIMRRFFQGDKEILKKTGKAYGCSGEAIRQQLEKALKTFKKKLNRKMFMD